ncbi:MAG: hypothetical protein HWD59_13630 [Coxiellaceae bacterium]|nr:MAG: hypothetical protein HWD59_13630 [Coxiellaceae bacterium]
MQTLVIYREKQFSIVEPVNYGINLTVVAEYSAIVQRFEVEYNKGLRQQKANEMNAPWSFSALAQAFGYRKSEGGNAKSDSNDQIIDNQSVFQL